jgi:hypothetical protein
MSSYLGRHRWREISLPWEEQSEVTHPPVAEDEKHAVAWVASYHRSDWDAAFLPFSDSRSSSLRSSTRHPFPSAPEADMGSMKSVPVEIVWRILGPLNVGSLLSFRQVNRRARQMVTSLPSYHLIAHQRCQQVKSTKSSLQVKSSQVSQVWISRDLTSQVDAPT